MHCEFGFTTVEGRRGEVQERSYEYANMGAYVIRIIEKMHASPPIMNMKIVAAFCCQPIRSPITMYIGNAMTAKSEAA